MNAPQVGEVFTLKRGKRVDTYRREADDPAPMFTSERIRITHLSCSLVHNWTPYVFGTEPEWFRQRGLAAPE